MKNPPHHFGLATAHHPNSKTRLGGSRSYAGWKFAGASDLRYWRIWCRGRNLVAGFCEHRHRTNSYRFSISQVDTDALRFKFQNSFRIWRIGSALKNRSALAQDQTEYRFGKKTGGKVVCPRCAPGLPAPDRLFSHFNSRSQLNRFDLGTVVERSLFRDSTSLSPLLVNDLTRQGGHSFVTILCPAPMFA